MCETMYSKQKSSKTSRYKCTRGRIELVGNKQVGERFKVGCYFCLDILAYLTRLRVWQYVVWRPVGLTDTWRLTCFGG